MNEDSKQKSLEFLKNQFQTYYEDNNVELPDRFGRREYAFVFYGGKGMMRHIGFDKKKKINTFLAENAPAHTYYSSAYYQKPDASTMNEKQWMGAELIFDLDSDHLPNADKLTFEQSLECVKEEFQKLVCEFLLDDFGFNKKYLDLYFSGGRGYHCHVKDPLVFDLDSSERREIVDYITGRDLRDTIIFREHATGRKQYGRRIFASGKSLKMPRPDESGWRGRISRGLIEIVNEIKNSEDPISKLKEYGVKHADAEKLINDLSDDRINRIKDGYLDQSKTIRKFFLNRALRQQAVQLSAGETDEPVTCDIKRLIRLPGSIHGKTGLRVTKINIDKIMDFNPLIKTIVFDDRIVTVNLSDPYTIEMSNTKFELEAGKQKVPSYLAVFLIGRRAATIL